jgi:serine protease Do
MRKILTILLVLLLAFGLSSCDRVPPPVQAETVEKVENEFASLIEFFVEDNILYWRNRATQVTTPVIDLSDIFQVEVVVGPQGEIGPQGIPGPQGEEGPEGPQGERGPAGASGSSGGSGPAGPPGPTGATGPAGATGPQGPAGAQGIEGEQGPQGIQGEQGERVILNSSGTSIFWRYENDIEWNLLIEIPTTNTTETIIETTIVESLTPEFRTNQTHVQWKYTTDNEWIDLFEIPTSTVITETITTNINQTNITIEAKDLSTIIEEVREGIVKFVSGSAVIYRKEGNTYYAVTNNHVYGDGGNMNLSYWLYGNRYETEATLVGRDPSTDLAVITFQSPLILPIISFGDSNTTKIGQAVFAIGNPNPAGLWYLTVTQGIISAQNRLLTSGEIESTYYIQHDAGTGPGNSGGGLFNTDGELIGITNLKSNSNFDNMAYAVTSNIIQRVILDLEEYQTETKLVRADFHLKLYTNPEPCNEIYGVCIDRVNNVSGSISITKNLQALDLIISFKNERMEDYITVYNRAQFNSLVLQTRVGELVSIQYYRNGVLYTSDEKPMSQ